MGMPDTPNRPDVCRSPPVPAPPPPLADALSSSSSGLRRPVDATPDALRRWGPGALILAGAAITVASFLLPAIVVSGGANYRLAPLGYGGAVAFGTAVVVAVLALCYLGRLRWVEPELLFGLGILLLVATLVDYQHALSALGEGSRYVSFNRLDVPSQLYDAMTVRMGIAPFVGIAGAILAMAGATWVLVVRPTGRAQGIVPVWAWGVVLAVVGLVALAVTTPVRLPQSFYFNVPGRPSVAPTPLPSPWVAPPNGPPALPSLAAPAPAAPHGPNGTAYQANAAHDGNATDAHVRLPLTREWTRRFNGAVGHPLVVAGQVFVPVSSQVGTADVVALDARSGRAEWRHAEDTQWGFLGLASDGGRLFTLSGKGELSAYTATTGALEWSARLDGQWEFHSNPTAHGGRLYVIGAGDMATLYAVDEETGAVVAHAHFDGDQSSTPTVDGPAVFVGLRCGGAIAFHADLGRPIWVHPGCADSLARTTAWYDGRLYVPDLSTDHGTILDATTGRSAGTFQATMIPSFGQLAYFVEDGGIMARNLSTMSPAWGFTGEGLIVSAPLVLGDYVCVATSEAQLYVLDLQGHPAGSYRLPGKTREGLATDDLSTIGMNAGGGFLAVSNGNGLVVYR